MSQTKKMVAAQHSTHIGSKKKNLTFHIKEARHCLTLGVNTLYNYLIMTRKISTPPFLLQIMILVVVRFFDEPINRRWRVVSIVCDEGIHQLWVDIIIIRIDHIYFVD